MLPMKILAHRGASGDAPQNTIAAMKLAIEQHCDGIELDAQLTKDNEVVIYHDWDIKTHSNSEGEIGDFTLAELKQFDFGSYFSDEFIGEKIPTLDEILDIVPEDILLNIELKIKSYNDAPLAEKTAEILKRRNRYKNIIISAFNHHNLTKVNKILPQIEVAFLYGGTLIDSVSYMNSTNLNIVSFNLHHDYVSKEVIDELHAQNKEVYIWTVNSVKEAKLFQNMGADGIITNYPDLMKNELNYKLIDERLINEKTKEHQMFYS
jgi:glycerophosphoryl diester phosphodiesterase